MITYLRTCQVQPGNALVGVVLEVWSLVLVLIKFNAVKLKKPQESGLLCVCVSCGDETTDSPKFGERIWNRSLGSAVRRRFEG